jgi:uncharacterized protein YbjQ (UPF0145 family)
MNFTDPNCPDRRRDVEIGGIPAGHVTNAPTVMFDAHSSVGDRTHGRAHSYSNISPAAAREIALSLLRAAANTPSKPTVIRAPRALEF